MTKESSIHAAINRYVEAGELAGAAALVWRDGHVVLTATVGKRDLQSELPVERDTIFRLASMTKPVTAAVALMLHDAGRFELDDPITVCAPEFAHMRVLRDPDGPLDQTVDAVRPITFRDLLTHRSGLTYPEFHRGPISRALGGWPGAYGGWWQADPNDRSVLIFLTHNMVELHQMMRGIGLTVWSAISSFHAIATSRRC
jgi:CubicO group peptidase (beta-lactamase class C family)